jgi:thiol-disulfide isomerase/thioredoxin
MQHSLLRRRLLAALALLCLGGAAVAADVSGPAPDFTLKSRDGSNLKLSELRGDVVMINFWASWCGPCRQEMPLLEDLHAKYQKLGFTLLGVNVEEDTAAANRMLKDIPVSFPVLYDPQNTVSKLYNVQAMPTTVLVDRDGKLRYLHRGYLPGYEVEYAKQVRALLRE